MKSLETEIVINASATVVWRIRGILVPLLWKNLETKTRSGFVKMNNSLKKRAEKEAGQNA
jgi:hypothetical protein